MHGSVLRRQRAPGWLAGGASAALAMVLSHSALAQPVTPTKDPKALEEAKKHWEAGQAFYNDPSGHHNCEEAVKEFGRAYELSGSVKAARARGICEMELEQDGPAMADFEVYLATPPKDAPPDEIAQVKSDDQRLKTIVATVTFQTDKPNTRLTAVHMRADGPAITNHYVVNPNGPPMKMHPGQYSFTAQSDGAPDITWQTEIQPSSQSTKSIDFAAALKAQAAGKPPPPPVDTEDQGTRPMPIAGWVMGGVTVACLGGMITAGVLGLKAKSTYDAQNGKASTATLTSLRKDVTTKNMVSDIFLGLTVAAAVTTTVLIITRPTVHKSATKTGFIVAPTVLARQGGEPSRYMVGGDVVSGRARPEVDGAGLLMLGSF